MDEVKNVGLPFNQGFEVAGRGSRALDASDLDDLRQAADAFEAIFVPLLRQLELRNWPMTCLVIRHPIHINPCWTINTRENLLRRRTWWLPSTRRPTGWPFCAVREK